MVSRRGPVGGADLTGVSPHVLGRPCSTADFTTLRPTEDVVEWWVLGRCHRIDDERRASTPRLVENVVRELGDVFLRFGASGLGNITRPPGAVGWIRQVLNWTVQLKHRDLGVFQLLEIAVSITEALIPLTNKRIIQAGRKTATTIAAVISHDTS